MSVRKSQEQVHLSPMLDQEAASNGSLSEMVGTVSDKHDMLRMGKKQELRRNFTFIPIFGFAAGLMITWEATMAGASYVLPNGGRPALIWMFLVSVFGFGCAILSMAEMASMAPTSGGQYHWVSEFAPKNTQKIVSYTVGWFCVLGWQAGIAGQSFAAASQIQGLIILNDETYIPENWHTTLLSIAVTTVCVLFNTFLIRRLPLVEGFVLILHMVGFIAILIPLWIFAPKATHADTWLNFTNMGGWPTTGLACLVGLTSSVNALIGPDSAVHMSEEVRDASRTIPLAMVWTLVLNSAMGFVMAVTFAYCLGPLEDALEPKYGFAFIGTYYNATQSHAGATIMTCIITSLHICSAISNVATGSRQLFAFARDNGMPFSPWLSFVRPGWDIPLNSVLMVYFVAVALSLINLGSSVAFNVLLSIGVVALLTSYLVSISCILIKRVRKEPLLPRRWSLGRWGLPLNIIGLAYLMVAFVFAFFPVQNPTDAYHMNWASAVYGAVAIASVLYYQLYAKHTYVAPVARLAKHL